MTPPPPPPQRNCPGTKWADFYSSFASIDHLLDSDSAFVYQDLLQHRIRLHRSQPDCLISVPDGGDPLVWQFEHLRQFCLELSLFVIAVQPECSSTTCPQMKANDWQYLCAAHPTPQNCCALDYIIHTLDGACGLLNNAKFFPSRISMPPNSVQQFANIARRLYRIFAHAYFHHRDAFQRAEVDTFLYARFLAFITQYDLMSKDTILIPSSSVSSE